MSHRSTQTTLLWKWEYLKTLRHEQVHYWKNPARLKSVTWCVETRLGCIITAPNLKNLRKKRRNQLENVFEERERKNKGLMKKAVRNAGLWTWSETSFKQRTKPANMKKKGLPESAANKGGEEEETFGIASAKVERSSWSPMNIDERVMCVLFPIRHWVCTHLLCLTDNQGRDADADAAPWPLSFVPVGFRRPRVPDGQHLLIFCLACGPVTKHWWGLRWRFG